MYKDLPYPVSVSTALAEAEIHTALLQQVAQNTRAAAAPQEVDI